jgi:hypothetical protein
MPELPISATDVLERYFLEVRCKLLEVAATLDRIDRAADRGSLANDPRLANIRSALTLIDNGGDWRGAGDRAERLQLLFSRPYSPDWRKEFGIDG